jgi:hypothetical protein
MESLDDTTLVTEFLTKNKWKNLKTKTQEWVELSYDVCLSRTGSKRYMSTQVFFGVKIDEQRIYI